MERSKIYLLLIFLAILSLFPNINLYEFRGEESLRTIVSYEMAHNGNLLQPTYLGDLYFNKPPLFNWFIIFSSNFIPWSELTARAVSILFLILTLILIYLFSFRLTKNREISVFSSLIYITFIDILFWYGYLAEIDVTLAFFVFLMFYFMFFGYREERKIYILISGVVTGIAFLLKGFPAFVFFGLTYISLILYSKNWKRLFDLYIWIAGVLSISIPVLWILNTEDPQRYIQILLFESLVRAKEDKNLLKLFEHFISYPVLNFKQLLPASGFVLAGFILYRKQKLEISPDLKLLLLILLINYLPYFISVGSRGRYVIPLFPILAFVFAYLIYSFKKDKLIKVFIYISLFFILLRFLMGFVGFPIVMEKKASRKKAAYDIAKIIDLKKEIAFDCVPEKTVCLYLDFMKGKPIVKSKFTKNWNYLLTCEKVQEGKLLKEYDLHGNILRVYERK